MKNKLNSLKLINRYKFQIECFDDNEFREYFVLQDNLIKYEKYNLIIGINQLGFRVMFDYLVKQTASTTYRP